VFLIVSWFPVILTVPFVGAVTYSDAKGGFDYKQTPYATKIAEEISNRYDGGKIQLLTGTALAHRIMQFSKISLKNFDNITFDNNYSSTYYYPEKYYKWVVICSEPDSDSSELVKYSIQDFDKLYEKYEIVYRNEFFVLLKLK
jgi:hypothetical protein